MPTPSFHLVDVCLNDPDPARANLVAVFRGKGWREEVVLLDLQMLQCQSASMMTRRGFDAEWVGRDRAFCEMTALDLLGKGGYQARLEKGYLYWGDRCPEGYDNKLASFRKWLPLQGSSPLPRVVQPRFYGLSADLFDPAIVARVGVHQFSPSSRRPSEHRFAYRLMNLFAKRLSFAD